MFHIPDCLDLILNGSSWFFYRDVQACFLHERTFTHKKMLLIYLHPIPLMFPPSTRMDQKQNSGEVGPDQTTPGVPLSPKGTVGLKAYGPVAMP